MLVVNKIPSFSKGNMIKLGKNAIQLINYCCTKQMQLKV